MKYQFKNYILAKMKVVRYRPMFGMKILFCNIPKISFIFQYDSILRFIGKNVTDNRCGKIIFEGKVN